MKFCLNTLFTLVVIFNVSFSDSVSRDDALDGLSELSDIADDELSELNDVAAIESFIEGVFGDSVCSDSERDLILASYVWESSQILTRDIQSYLIFSQAGAADASSFIDNFNSVVAMRNGEEPYSSEFPLLEGQTRTFDDIYREIFNDAEFALYQQAITASNALVSLETMAQELIEAATPNYDMARQLLFSTMYYEPKQRIEAAAKGAFNLLAERRGCS